MEVSFTSSKEKPQIVFLLGAPGSGKSTQAAKLVRDYKFTHLSVGELLRAEAENKTKEGQEIHALESKGELVPSELTVKVLVKAMKTKNAKKYLIDGFPRSLDQALYFERNFREIDYIINYEIPDEVALERLLKRASQEGRYDDNEETITKRLHIFHTETEPVTRFYERFGKVATVPASGSIDETYKLTLEALQPNLIFFYGPPASGQEQLAEQLADLTTYKLIKIQDYYRANGLTNASDEVKIDHLITFFLNNYQRNFILHDFPENIRQVKIFVEHFAAPKKFYYFDFTKDQVENHIKDKPKQQRQVILQEYERYVQNRKEILKYFNNKPYFIKIKDDENVDKVWNSVVESIAPEIIACPTLPDDDFSHNYLAKIERQRGYVYLDVVSLIQDEIKRGTELGKELNSALQTGENVGQPQIELLRKVMFNNLRRTKFILGGYPESFGYLDYFELTCCKIKNVIAFTHKPLALKGENLYAHYHAKGKLIKIQSDHLDQFDSYVKNRCRYGFIVGPEAAGRPTITTYLKNKYATQLVNYEQTIELLKVKLSTEDNQVEEVPFPEIIKHFKAEIDSRDRSHNILFEGWPYEKEQLEAFVKEVGAPTYVFWLDATEENLAKRIAIENKVDEIDESDREKINEELTKTKQLIQVFQDSIADGNNIHLFDIKVGISTESTLKDINNIIYKKVFVFRNVSSKTTGPELRDHVINLCVNNNVTFIDVADLVNENFAETNDLSKKLQSQAIMTDFSSQFTAPSFFTPTLITDLIQKYLLAHPSNKYILLYNYPSAEGKQESKLYPRAIDELYQIEASIGPLKEIITVCDAPQDFEINDPFEERPVQEEVKVEVKPPKGEGEEEEEAEPEPPKEEEEDEDAKPKFNPLEYNWTVSDGNPKTLAQVYRRRTNCDYLLLETDSQEFNGLEDLLKSSIAKFEEGDNKDKDCYVEVIIN